jgi:hypothetical protein
MEYKKRDGAEGGNQTHDLSITNRALYQLSYFGPAYTILIHSSIFCNAARASASGIIV